MNTKGTSLSSNGFTLVEMMLVMGVLATLSITLAVQSVYRQQTAQADFKNEAKNLKVFLTKASHRAYLSGLCTTLNFKDSKTLTIQTWKKADAGCAGNFSEPAGETLTFQVSTDEMQLTQFEIEGETKAATEIKFNREGGTVVPNRGKITLQVGNTVYHKRLSILSAVGQVIEEKDGTTVAQ